MTMYIIFRFLWGDGVGNQNLKLGVLQEMCLCLQSCHIADKHHFQLFCCHGFKAILLYIVYIYISGTTVGLRSIHLGTQMIRTIRFRSGLSAQRRVVPWQLCWTNSGEPHILVAPSAHNLKS